MEKVMRFSRGFWLALLCMVISTLAGSTLAQEEPVGAEPPPEASPDKPAESPKASPPPAKPKAHKTTGKKPAKRRGPPTPEMIEKASAHFQRGLDLFNEGALEAALVEFERAYELAPSYKILYNLGRIHRALNQYAEALSEFERYLAEGGDEIASDRRDEVNAEIRGLQPRVAKIEVVANVKGAVIAIDDAPMGTAPLRHPIIVNPGTRRVSASAKGYIPATRVIRVVGSDAVKVKLQLVSLKREPEKPVDPGPRNAAIGAWVGTAAFAGAAIAMGVLALNTKSDLDAAKEARQADPAAAAADLDSQADKVTLYSALTDAFAAVAVVGAGVSIYLTVVAVRGADPEEEPEKKTIPQARVLSPRPVLGVTGTF